MCSDHDHAIHEVAGAEEALADLRGRVEALEVALAAEREVGAAVAEGHQSIPSLVAALRKRGETLINYKGPAHPGIFEHPADVDRRMWLGTELLALATQIEQEA